MDTTSADPTIPAEARPRASGSRTLPRAVEETLATLPAQPGCYLFKDTEGIVLYVGKARSLRDRVRSYFRDFSGLSLKNRHLVPRIASIDYQIVDSENAALLLEYNLIKQHRPKYNIRLMDDKSYLSIRITQEPYPRIDTVRRKSDDGARYFGPYTSAQSVYRTLDLLKRLFPYRSCRLNIVPPVLDAGAGTAVAQRPVSLKRGRRVRASDVQPVRVDAAGGKPPQERTRTVADPQNRACLEYHIHRCAAPCINAISRADYAAIVDQAALFLAGKSEQLVASLQRSMEEAAENLEFERAARLRDQLEAVRRITERQRVTVLDGHDRDIVGLARAGDDACVELIAVRDGRMLGHKQFVLQGTAEQGDGAVLSAFLTQFYLDVGDLPEELLLPAEPDDAAALASLLGEQRGRKMSLQAPRRGEKHALVELAQKNAEESAEQRKLRWQGDNQKLAQALGDLQAALGLPRLPMRIECFDISTIQGTSTVGSMVVFEHGKPKTAAYRRFQIKTVVGADDFASMAEMVRRRLRRAHAGPSGAPLATDTGADDAAGHAEAGDLEALVEEAYADADAAALAGRSPEALVEDTVELAAAELPDESAQLTGDPHDGAAGQGDAAGDGASAEPESEWTRRPDLMIIDGGKGQLGAVLAVFEELGITDQPVVGLAKQREELFLPGRPDPILLPAGSQALFLVQRVRDEAHRFAITYHRNVRGRRSLESSLDAVPGVGGKRKRDLLRHFGSLAALRRAPLDEIAALPGIGPKTAQVIKEHLGDG